MKFQNHGTVGFFAFLQRLCQVFPPFYGICHRSALLSFFEKTADPSSPEEVAPFCFLVFGVPNAALIRAAILLSAARLPRVAAAVVEILDFQPIVTEKEMNLGGPGTRSLQISEKIPKTGPAPVHEVPFIPCS
jgi:hypothetical protein